MSLIRYICLWIIPYTISLAASSTIQGHITDSRNGEPLFGANIMLLETSMGNASDENGNYLISNIPIGNYTLRAMFIGYKNLEKEIWVEADQVYTIDIILESSAIELQETRVTAEKRKEKITGAPASIDIITSRDLKGKTTTNMGAYLKGLKGIDFTSSGINNYSISVRGFNSSFNTRLLTLSDGRVANIPALRVINYSTIPQSMDDVDKIEIILGPATALYGANAHSGVVNIISLPPAQSEGLTMSISGSQDDRQLRKINGRFAQKLSNSLSIKISGLYIHAYDWSFISEDEYKTHRFPWSLTPHYVKDGKDNNPSVTAGNRNFPFGEGVDWVENNRGQLVRIGNGEADHLDWDGDGVAGEDWWNGHDDDGDAIDSDGDGWCDGQEVRWASENNLDQEGWNNATNTPNEPIEDFSNWIDEDYFTADGEDNNGDNEIDEKIDQVQDFGYDGIDNDNNGIVDDEAGNQYINTNIKAWGENIDINNILVNDGRVMERLIDGKLNPYYIPGYTDIHGNHRFNADKLVLEFDVFNYDFGTDGLPGDPFKDLAGDNIYQPGEKLVADLTGELSFNDWLSDCGLDGICQYLTMPYDQDGDLIIDEITGTPNPEWPGADADGTERNGIWEPGDGWMDNDLDGIVNIDFDSWQETTSTTADTYIWPPKNGYWDEGEEIYDCGNDGYCWGDSNGDSYVDEQDNSAEWVIGNPHYVPDLTTIVTGDSIWIYGPDPGDGNGKNPYDYGENDQRFDTGDKHYGRSAEDYEDSNDNGRWDPGEYFTDINNDGRYTPADLTDNFQSILDKDGDGLSDYPDFEIDNRKVEFRLDFDPNPDFNLTFQSGYSWTKTQQVTGTGRYIADGFEYKFYQIRGRYKNWFSQFYMNQSFSGKTRGYNLGNRILDESKNYAFQIQNNFDSQSLNTKFVWGMDYFRTDPQTYGTILNDGPNGYDNDGDNVYLTQDGIDNDGDTLIDDLICPDGFGEGFRKGKYWQCGEGIDEPDEFVDPLSNEYGIYYQSTTELFGTSRYELITAARFDYHDMLKEGILFAPKIGFIYKPDSKSSMRFTYGKAHNTPSSITLHTDLFVGSVGLFNIYLRGNQDGTPYCRVGLPCFDQESYSVVEPGFYSKDGTTFYKMGSEDNASYFEGYSERVNGAPYFFKVQPDITTILAGDMLPLDTSLYVIYIPELNDEGVLYTPEESINLSDIDPIRTEKIQTFEFGYKGFLGNKTHFSLDYYLSYYEDFFSPPTFITPFVVEREFDNAGNDITTVDNINVIGLMPVNDIGTHPPYGTAWNGLDDDGDWVEWADDFGWWDDKNGDGNPVDRGEWGGVLNESGMTATGVSYNAGDIFFPHEVLSNRDGLPIFLEDYDGKWTAVGVDELHSKFGLSEFEPVLTGLLDSNEEQVIGPGNASGITDLVLSPMNYGEVWMQGVDFGMTHFITEKLILNGNVSWYGTTEFKNELTKRNDPINAPKWKWNASIKWDSSLGDFILNYRHVEKFKWKDGLWVGFIGPYDIIDLFYTYHITNNLNLNISALNLNNDLHRELVGGAMMGRQLLMRFTTTF